MMLSLEYILENLYIYVSYAPCLFSVFPLNLLFVRYTFTSTVVQFIKDCLFATL